MDVAIDISYIQGALLALFKRHCFQHGKLITPSYAWSKFTLVPLHLSMPAGCLSTCLSFYLHVLFYNYMDRLSWKAHIVSLNQYCLPGISYVENAHFFKPEDSWSSHFGGQIKDEMHGSPPAWTLHFQFCAAMFLKKLASSPCLSNKERFPESFSAKTRRKTWLWHIDGAALNIAIIPSIMQFWTPRSGLSGAL